jgi:CMP/dCMP kinase
MDGRDIGTVVFPDAELKIFMTASPQVRAERRLLELRQSGSKESFDSVLKNIMERDYIDTHREVAPLVQAPDAVVLDNSNMTISDQFVWLSAILLKRFNITI